MRSRVPSWTNCCRHCSQSRFDDVTARLRVIGNEPMFTAEHYEKPGVTRILQKLLVRFHCGHIARRAVVIAMSTRNCPACVKYGFNPSKPGVAYLKKFNGGRCTPHLKFGITTGDHRRRYLSRLRSGVKEHTLRFIDYRLAAHAKRFEDELKVATRRYRFGGRCAFGRHKKGSRETCTMAALPVLLNMFEQEANR